MEKIVKICPFCGKVPHYDEKNQTVHCETLDCAVGDFYIHIDEWNKRYNDNNDVENNSITVNRNIPDRIILQIILILCWCRLDGQHKIIDRKKVLEIKAMDYDQLSDVATAKTLDVITFLPWKNFRNTIDPRNIKSIDYYRAIMLLRYGQSDFLTVNKIFVADEKGIKNIVQSVINHVEYITTKGDFEL